jgi:hypothetical protein
MLSLLPLETTSERVGNSLTNSFGRSNAGAVLGLVPPEAVSFALLGAANRPRTTDRQEILSRLASNQQSTIRTILGFIDTQHFR